MAEYLVGGYPAECTYGEAKKNAELIARGVASAAGSDGAYIGLYANNCVEWMIMFWAILRSGNKPYLMNLRQPKDFSQSILSTLDCQLVIYKDEVEDFSVKSLSYAELYKLGKEAPAIENSVFGNEMALSTSGTTLSKKICFYTGKEICAQIINMKQMQKKMPYLTNTYEGKLKHLVFLPLYHIFGLVATYLWYAAWGSTFVFLKDMSPETILSTVRAHKVTHIFSVPLLWNSIEKTLRFNLSTKDEKTKQKFDRALKMSIDLQDICPALGRKFASAAFSDVRCRLLGESICCCVTGGSFVRESTLEIINGLGYPLLNGYGMTEIGISAVQCAGKIKERIKGSVGEPFSSVEFKISEEGILLVKGDSVCHRIVADGIERENKEWFSTGDVMTCDSKGSYYIKGRESDVVFGDDGENLNPDFAEEAFLLPDVVNYSVLGNRDNSKLMLVVQIPKGLLEVQRQKLKTAIEECNMKLPNSYKVKKVKFTYDQILTPGAIKVSRALLRKEIASGKIKLFDLDAEEQAAVQGEDTELKIILRGLFAKALKRKSSDIPDNGHFMDDLGGSSLDYFTLIGEIDKRFGVTLGYENQQFGYSVEEFEKILEKLISSV
ncbi:MAG: AMP-binding protein [Ruminococcus sp.]